ncbi:hypothetical protein B7C51_16670 [Paenibacillus larvae subsp. pulvifaciens]|uniref:Uncharacterized protein n=1 Tax=Paenibacillus larvae subsp. pulvifaciens TaxID=1477 RepID=A0A1V0UVA8_9BACL|nr:hypothetical protein B7C51_16670 [Paenibacillus larvae subsp. pulvifaciens]
MPAEASAPKKPGEAIVLFLDGEADSVHPGGWARDGCCLEPKPQGCALGGYGQACNKCADQQS